MKNETKLEIYQKPEKQWDRAKANLLKSKLTQDQKDLTLEYLDWLKSIGSGKRRCVKVCSKMMQLNTWAGKNLSQLTHKDLIALTNHIQDREGISKATKEDYKQILRQFYNWYEDEDPRLQQGHQDHETALKFYKYLRKHFKVKQYLKEIDPSQVLQDEDLALILGATNNTRDQALISFLYETGVRAGELLNLKIRDIEITKHCSVAYVNGKTGRRSVWFVQSMAYMVRWLQTHPDRNNQDSYLWLTNANNQRKQPLRHRALIKMINETCERAGLTKPHNPHFFRHSSASRNAADWTEAVLCSYYGWVLGSKQVRTYIHMKPDSVKNQVMRLHGIYQEDEIKQKALPCGCGVANTPGSKYCLNCGNPLSVAVAMSRAEQVQKRTDEVLAEMLETFKDPEMLASFQKFLAAETQG